MTHANFHKRELGYGAYTVADVSIILGKSYQKVSQYIKQYGDVKFGKKLFKETYSWELDGSRVINFSALVEIYVFLLLREKYNLKISEINKAREALAVAFNTPYPFATRQIYTDRNKVYYDNHDDLVDASKEHQINLKEIVAPLLEKIEFENGRAIQYFPLGKKHSVVVDPLHQHGQPTVKDSNLRTETLWRMYQSGEPKENIKILYDLTTEELDDALLFYHYKRVA